MSTLRLLLLALAISGCSDPQDRGITGEQLERLWELQRRHSETPNTKVE